MFAGLVILATRVPPFRSSVAVAGATPVIVALFNPLRRRVQRTVDRRFDRARYDAGAVVVAFTARPRRRRSGRHPGHLVGDVHEAFQPAHASVWLPGPESPSRPAARR